MSSTKRYYEAARMNEPAPCVDCGTTISMATAPRMCDICGGLICRNCAKAMDERESSMCSTCEDNLIYQRDD